MTRQKPEKPSNAPAGTYWLGGPVDRCTVSLRIIGDSLIPDEITRVMGVSPDSTQRKGDLIRSNDGKHSRTARCGVWTIEQKPASGEEWDLEAAVCELLSLLPSDLTIWTNLAQEFEIDLFCGLFLKAHNRGLELSSSVLRQLGERHIKLGLDIYSPSFDAGIRAFLK